MEFRPRTMRVGASIGWAVACLMATLDARAEIHESAQRLAEAWRAAGAVVIVDAPRFVHSRDDNGHAVTATLPKIPAAECTTVALLGARSFGFHVRLPAHSESDPFSVGDPRGVPVLSSVAGALSMEWCGQAPEQRFAIASDAGRGAIELVAASSPQPLPSLVSLLPERASPPPIQGGDDVARPKLPSARARTAVAEARARLDDGSAPAYSRWLANSRGAGSADLVLGPGCHTIALVAADPARTTDDPRRRLDLDAEIRSMSDDSLLARDRGDAPDARLEVCVGESTAVTVTFVGAPPGGPVTMAHTVSQLPQHLPKFWGPAVVGRIAQLLRAHHVTALPFDAAWTGQGGSGATTVTVPVEAGACYLIIAPQISGLARSVGLSVRTSDAIAFDDRGRTGIGALAAFCAGARSLARIDVTARGSRGLMWGLLLYRVSSGNWLGSR